MLSMPLISFRMASASGRRHSPRMTRFSLERIITHYPEHPVRLCFKTVETIMVLHDQENHQRCADADGKSQNIDHGKDSVAAEVPQRDEQVVFEHGSVFAPFTRTKGYAIWRRYCESVIYQSFIGIHCPGSDGSVRM